MKYSDQTPSDVYPQAVDGYIDATPPLPLHRFLFHDKTRRPEMCPPGFRPCRNCVLHYVYNICRKPLREFMPESNNRLLVLHINHLGRHKLIQTMLAIGAANTRFFNPGMEALDRFKVFAVDIGLAGFQIAHRLAGTGQTAGKNR